MARTRRHSRKPSVPFGAYVPFEYRCPCCGLEKSLNTENEWRKWFRACPACQATPTERRICGANVKKG